MIFSGLKLKKNDFFFHNEMIYNFPELGKTKPVNSKTRFVTLKLQNIWSDFSSNIGYLLSKLEVMGREGAGNRQRRGLSLLLGSAFRGACAVPTLYSEHPLSLLGLLPPPPTPHHRQGVGGFYCFTPPLEGGSHCAFSMGHEGEVTLTSVKVRKW